MHLAKLLRRGGNLILLDEPTNDLDVGTMRVLEQALIDFPGCAMVISHDRFFLDRIVHAPADHGRRRRDAMVRGQLRRTTRRPLAAEHPDRVAHRRGKYKRLTLKK